MANENYVELIGNLGTDIELRFTGSGTAVTNLRMATNEFHTDKTGTRQKHTEWHRVVIWGKTAENCAKYLTKGRQIRVKGRLRTRTWEDRDGNKRYTTEVHAFQVDFLGTAPQQAQQEIPAAVVPEVSEEAQTVFRTE